MSDSIAAAPVSGAGLLLWLLSPSHAAAVPEPLLETTVRLLTLDATSRRVVLKSRFAGALWLSETAPGRGIDWRRRWLWPVLTMAAILLGLTCSAALGVNGHLAPDVDPTTLPANLTDILKVDCG